jgi:hypothetical protein
MWSIGRFDDYRHRAQVASLCRQFGIDPLKVTKKTVDKAFRRLMLRLYAFPPLYCSTTTHSAHSTGTPTRGNTTGHSIASSLNLSQDGNYCCPLSTWHQLHRPLHRHRTTVTRMTTQVWLFFSPYIDQCCSLVRGTKIVAGDWIPFSCRRSSCCSHHNHRRRKQQRRRGATNLDIDGATAATTRGTTRIVILCYEPLCTTTFLIWTTVSLL